MMIDKSTFAFLSSLKQNNNRDWFEAHRKDYQAAKENVLQFAGAVLHELVLFDETLKHLKPADGLFRINRDVRFSADKSPYKTNMGFYFSAGGKKAEDKGGYYVHVEPANNFAACGLWQPPAAMLKKVRQEIDYNSDVFNTIVGDKGLKKNFGALTDHRLSRPPKGYEGNNPAIEHLRQKSFIYTSPLSNAYLQQKSAAQKVGQLFKPAVPFIRFLNAAMEE